MQRCDIRTSIKADVESGLWELHRPFDDWLFELEYLKNWACGRGHYVDDAVWEILIVSVICIMDTWQLTFELAWSCVTTESKFNCDSDEYISEYGKQQETILARRSSVWGQDDLVKRIIKAAALLVNYLEN